LATAAALNLTTSRTTGQVSLRRNEPQGALWLRHNLKISLRRNEPDTAARCRDRPIQPLWHLSVPLPWARILTVNRARENSNRVGPGQRGRASPRDSAMVPPPRARASAPLRILHTPR
jgi:hypothetical protein